MTEEELARLAGEEGHLGDLLRGAQRDLPAAEQLAAASTQLAAKLAAGGGAAGAGRSLSSAAKLAVLGAFGLLAAGGVAWWLTTPAADTAQVEAPEPRQAPVEPAPQLPAVSAEPAPEELPSRSETTAPEPDSARPAPSSAPGAAKPSEAQLLEAARRALGSQPAHALALTQEHRRRFPRGMLAQEREVIAIEALQRLKRHKEASEKANQFEREHQGSAHGKKVDSIVDGG